MKQRKNYNYDYEGANIDTVELCQVNLKAEMVAMFFT